MKIDKTKLDKKEKEIYEKIQKAIKIDKKKGEKFRDDFIKVLLKKKSKAVAEAPKKSGAATPKKTTTSGANQLLKMQSKDIARIEKELGVTKKEATRIAKSKRKNTKGKSESVSQLIARFKKQFAIPPHAERDFKKDEGIPAKTAVKRKSPTYGKAGGAKKPYYYEYRMNRRDNSKVPAYLEEGGEVLNIITFDNKASRDEFMKEMNVIAPDNSLLILDDVSIQNMGAKSDVDFFNERAKSFNGEFYAKGGEIKGLNIYFDENYTGKKEVKDIITNIGIIDEKEHINDYGDAIFIYADDVPAVYLKGIYEDILKSDLDVESIELFKKGGKIGFEALSDKVAKRYEGKEVPSKFRDEYGEKYDKEEAKEVGDKVAAKVYRQQQAKMEEGGETRTKKPYIATILMEKGGETVSVNNFDWKSRPLKLSVNATKNKYGYPRVHDFNNKQYILQYNFDTKREALNLIKETGMVDSILQPIEYYDGKGEGMPKYFLYTSKDSFRKMAKGGQLQDNINALAEITDIVDDREQAVRDFEDFFNVYDTYDNDELKQQSEMIISKHYGGVDYNENLDNIYMIIDKYYAKGGEVTLDDLVFVEPQDKEKFLDGGVIIGALAGAYVGYKIGRSRPQKKGFETEKKLASKLSSEVKKVKDSIKTKK